MYNSLIYFEKPLYSNENMSEDIIFINGCDEIVDGEKYHTFYFYYKNSKSSHITFEARFKECVKIFDESAKFFNESNSVFKKDNTTSKRDVHSTCLAFLKQKQCIHIYEVLNEKNKNSNVLAYKSTIKHNFSA